MHHTRRQSIRHLKADYNQKPARGTPHEAAEILRQDVGPVVYFVRCLDGRVKIGYSADLANRLAMLGLQWEDLLAVAPGGRDAERHLHKHFQHLRIFGVEYFKPGLDLVEHVNQLRVALGVPPVTPWEMTALPPLVELDTMP